MLVIYDLIVILIAAFYLPRLFLKKKFHRDIWQRIGFYPPELRAQGAIWLHAVSVGEVAAIKPLWEAIRKEYPGAKIVVSTITQTGNDLARRFAREGEVVFYLPLDLRIIVEQVLRRVDPRIVIIAETEIWPNLIGCAFRKNIPVMIVNGRISDRAYPRYYLARSIFGRILRKISGICARSEDDRKKFIALGVSPARVQITGNIKYCDPALRAVLDLRAIRARYAIGEADTVIMAGSTHKGEEEILLDLFRSLRRDVGGLHLIIAPRRIERCDEITRLAAGLPVTIIDTFGVMKELYAIADIAFVGGSLVEHGGHNIIEPALFAKPVIFGPHMFNFKDIAEEFLKSGAAVLVRDAHELEIACRRLLKSKDERYRLGANAKAVVLRNQGALAATMDEVRKVLAHG
ncbi:MAG: 3-deoxy-D-manno-octulosonic acid transferase [Candidatus Omnitrophota bacterium]